MFRQCFTFYRNAYVCGANQDNVDDHASTVHAYGYVSAIHLLKSHHAHDYDDHHYVYDNENAQHNYESVNVCAIIHL